MGLKICFFLSLLICGIIISGCSKNSGGASNSCDTSNMTYRKDILPIIQNYCFAFHSNATMAFSNNTGYNFEHGNDSLSWLFFQAIDTLAVHNIRHDPGYIGMPYLKPKIPECDINKILAWFNNPNLPY